MSLYQQSVPGEIRLELEAQAASKARRWRLRLPTLRGVLVPSFFGSGKDTGSRVEPGLAALDGLRGLACLAVVNQRKSPQLLPTRHSYSQTTRRRSRRRSIT